MVLKSISIEYLKERDNYKNRGNNHKKEVPSKIFIF